MSKRIRTTDTVAFDGVPVFRGLALMLHHARKHGWQGRLNSADRRNGVAERYGRMSQVALYAGFIAHKAGFLPANPPGRSSHELRSDGVAYRGPVGRPLAWWQLGLDVTQDEQLLRILKPLGYAATHPYTSASEAHHVNLTASPYRKLVAANLVRRSAARVQERTGSARASMLHRTSASGIKLITTFEGFSAAAYRLPGEKYWTVGYGHYGPDVDRLAHVTRVQADALLVRDVRSAEAAVNGLKVGLTQHEFDALVSFTYNVGTGALATSTLVRKLRAGDYRGAADQLLRWNKGGDGKTVLAGLTRRRAAERALFLS